MERQKEYFAFISYKREDEKWAKWLQHKLEHYHLPTNVRKENPSLPQVIRPVFKDTSELAAGVLADEIHEALENSKYLIVICSPRAAQSKWIGKEVQTFIDMGRTDKVIPFIIGGTPFSDNPQEECFPSTLLELPKEQELLGVNINEMGRDAAVVKVVARMFGLKFDTLWQRHEREQKRKRWIWIGGSILFALSGIGIGAYFIKQNRTIDNQNVQLLNAANRLREDSVTLANHVSRIQADSVRLVRKNDSIILQNELINKQRIDLMQTNNSLDAANLSLKQERDNLERANWDIKKSHARAIAGIANTLTDNGDSYTARLVAMEVFPTEEMSSLPYVEEVEFAIRKSLEDNNAILKGHSDNVETVAYSPDGKYIISGAKGTNRTYDGAVRLWDVLSGKNLGIIGKHSNGITCVKFSPDGKYIASASLDGKVKLFFKDKSQWEEVFIDTLQYTADMISFSPNNQVFAYSENDGTIYVRENNSHTLLKTLKIKAGVKLMEFSPDGMLVSCDDEDGGYIRIWDSRNFAQKDSFKISNKEYSIQSITFSPDKKSIAIAAIETMPDNENPDSVLSKFGLQQTKLKSTVQIRDMKAFKLQRRLYIDDVKHIEYSHNGKTLFVAGRSSFGAWNIKSWSYEEIKRDIGFIRALAVNPNGESVAIGYGHIVRLLDTRMTNGICDLSDDKISKPVLDKNGNVYAIRDGDRIAFWSRKQHSWKNILQEKAFLYFTDYAISNNGEMIVTINAEAIKLWKKEKGWKLVMERKPGVGRYSYRTAIQFSLNDELLVVAYGTNILIWDTNRLSSVHISPMLIDNKGEVSSLCISNDKKRLITASFDSKIRLWDLSADTLLKTLSGHTMPVVDVSVSPDDKVLASVSSDGTLRLWDAVNGNSKDSIILSQDGGTILPSKISFCPYNSYLIVGFNGITNIYNYVTQRLLGTMNGKLISLRPNGTEILVARDFLERRLSIKPVNIEALISIIKKQFENRK